MKTLIVKSLLSSLCQREGIYPSLAKRGVGRFFNNDALLMHLLITHDSKLVTFIGSRIKILPQPSHFFHVAYFASPDYRE